jgi:hypothetical protein
MILACKVIFVLLLFRFFITLLDILYKRPHRNANKAFEKAVVRRKPLGEKLIDGLITPLAFLIEPIIYISREKEMAVDSELKRAGINDSPKLYYAKSVVTAALVIPLPFLLYIIGMIYLVPAGALMIAAIFYRQATGYKEILKQKRELIERLLPGFIRSILYRLNENREGLVKADLISIFENYLRVANPVFAYDVSVLIMEMKAKDVEPALRNFNNRLGIPEVNFLCNALIGITRGEHQGDILASLAREMDVKVKENIRRELDKRPGKVYRACIPLVLISFVAIAYVLITAVMGGVSSFI